MDFRVEHTIEHISRDAFAELFFDEELNIALCDALQLKRVLIQRTDTNGVLERRVEVMPQRQLPSWVTGFIGTRSMAYVETMRYVRGSYCGSWEIIPHLFARQLKCYGTVTFTDHPRGVGREVAGRVEVGLVGLGRPLEKFIVGEIESTFALAARLTADWLAQRDQSGPDPDFVSSQ